MTHIKAKIVKDSYIRLEGAYIKLPVNTIITVHKFNSGDPGSYSCNLKGIDIDFDSLGGGEGILFEEID